MHYNIIDLYKDAYSGLSKKSWYLYIVMLVNRSGTMVIPFMTIYCTQRLNFSLTQAGFIMALFGTGAVAGAFLGGKIVDAIGFYWLQLGSLMTGGIMFIITGYLQTFYSLCAGVLILSICNESFRPANATAIAHYSAPENRTRSYSLNRLAINVGWAVGGALGGFLAAHNYKLLFWVDGLTNISAAIFLVLLLPAVKSVAPKHERKIITENGSPFKDKTYLFFIALVVLFAICFFQLFTMLPVFYKIQWHFSEQFIGILMAVNGIIIAIVEMVMIYNLEGKKQPAYYIGIGTLMLGFGFILLNFFPAMQMSAVICIVVITFGEMFAMSFMNTYWISRSAENNRGRYAALYSMAWSCAQIIAPTMGSQVAQHFGFNYLWFLTGLISVIVYFGFIVIKRKTFILAGVKN
jgi:predicted MFS family arabinose efflux permease